MYIYLNIYMYIYMCTFIYVNMYTGLYYRSVYIHTYEMTVRAPLLEFRGRKQYLYTYLVYIYTYIHEIHIMYYSQMFKYTDT